MHFLIFSLIVFISLIFFSIFIHSLINGANLSSLNSIFLIFSKDNFILFGNFSLCFKIFSSKYISLNCLSTFNKSSSSLLFISFVILVNVFCISNFNSSLFLFIFSIVTFKLSIESCIVSDISSKYFILDIILFFFSSFTSSIKQTLQSLCCPIFFLKFYKDKQCNIKYCDLYKRILIYLYDWVLCKNL